MLGTLRNEGEPSDCIVRLPSRVGVDGARSESCLILCSDAYAEGELSPGPVEVALVLNDRPLGASGASGVGNETDRIARGAPTGTVFSKGTARIDEPGSDRSGNDVETSLTIILA